MKIAILYMLAFSLNAQTHFVKLDSNRPQEIKCQFSESSSDFYSFINDSDLPNSKFLVRAREDSQKIYRKYKGNYDYALFVFNDEGELPEFPFYEVSYDQLGTHWVTNTYILEGLESATDQQKTFLGYCYVQNL